MFDKVSWSDIAAAHNRHHLVHAAAGAVALPAVSRIAWAQASPALLQPC
jgi:hypothetical protein